MAHEVAVTAIEERTESVGGTSSRKSSLQDGSRSGRFRSLDSVDANANAIGSAAHL